MDFILIHVLTATAAFLAMTGAYKSVKDLKKRILIEKKLARNLATELKARDLQSEVSVKLNKITIEHLYFDAHFDLDLFSITTAEAEEKEGFVKDLIDSVRAAVNSLTKEERRIVSGALEQTSEEGRFRYLKKLVSNSLNEIEHQRA